MTPGKIFFSYSRQDAEAFAFKLASDLRGVGANVWIDQLDIAPGKNWDEEIERALDESIYILFIASEKSVSSQNVLNEIYYAVDENKTVLPIRIHDCTIPFRIRRFQYIDFTGDYRAAFDRLVKHLELQVDNDTFKSDPRESIQLPVGKQQQVADQTTSANESVAPVKSTVKRNKNLLLTAVSVIVIAVIVVFGLLRRDSKEDRPLNHLATDSSLANVDSATLTEQDSTLSNTSTTKAMTGGAKEEVVSPSRQRTAAELGEDESENAKVDVEAKYPGGRSGWIQYLKHTLNYPQQARREKVEGTVFVRFRVDSTGRISNVTAVEGPMAGGLRKEAIRIVQNSGPWEPAIRSGRNVSIYKRISIPFKLEN